MAAEAGRGKVMTAILAQGAAGDNDYYGFQLMRLNGEGFVSTTCDSGRVINLEYPPATAGGTDLTPRPSGRS